MKTQGISPKVKNPLVAGLIVGVCLLVAGFVADDQTLRAAGITAIAGALGYGGLGAASSPGNVTWDAIPGGAAPEEEARE